MVARLVYKDLIVVYLILIKLAHSFNYNDLDSLEKYLKESWEIACVIMEPLTILEPACYGLKNCKNKSCRKFCKRNSSEVKWHALWCTSYF